MQITAPPSTLLHPKAEAAGEAQVRGGDTIPPPPPVFRKWHFHAATALPSSPSEGKPGWGHIFILLRRFILARTRSNLYGLFRPPPAQENWHGKFMMQRGGGGGQRRIKGGEDAPLPAQFTQRPLPLLFPLFPSSIRF